MDPELDILINRMREALHTLKERHPDATAAQMAKAAHKVLERMARRAGHNPDIEVSIWAPGERAGLDRWRVSYEAGPYEWAVVASMGSIFNGFGEHIVEPYYSFDLCFYPSQDKGAKR